MPSLETSKSKQSNYDKILSNLSDVFHHTKMLLLWRKHEFKIDTNIVGRMI